MQLSPVLGGTTNSASTTKIKEAQLKRTTFLEEFYNDPFFGTADLNESIAGAKFTSQAEAFARLLNRENVFISGLAGAGKTTVINKFIKYIDAAFDGAFLVSVTASTGVAATLFENGRTLHSWAGWTPEISEKPEFDRRDITKNTDKVNLMKYTDILIIDEISMIPAHLIVRLDAQLKHIRKSELPFGGIQLVLLGDFLQLPPVKNRHTNPELDMGFCINTEAWENANIKSLFLDRLHRATDTQLKKVIHAIINGKVDYEIEAMLKRRMGGKELEDPNKVYTNLFTTNASVDKYNLEELSKIPSTARTFYTKAYGAPDKIKQLLQNSVTPERLELKVGAVVMLTKNNVGGSPNLVNGTIGKVTGFAMGSNYPIVQFNNGVRTEIGLVETALTEMKSEEVLINGVLKKYAYPNKVASIMQIPLKLAWAISVHKSQGQSFAGVSADLSNCFTPGLGYVALTRVSNLDDLVIRGMDKRVYKLDAKSLIASKKTRRDAVLNRRDFLKNMEMYEDMFLENSINRMITWDENNGGTEKYLSTFTKF